MLRTLSLALISLLVMAPAFALNNRNDGTIMGGAGPDPGGMWVELSDLVDLVAADHQIPDDQRDAFKSRIFLSYSQQRLESHGGVQGELNGRIRLPTCRSEQSYSFQLKSMEVGNDSLKVGSMEELVGEQVELALVEFATGCTAL